MKEKGENVCFLLFMLRENSCSSVSSSVKAGNARREWQTSKRMAWLISFPSQFSQGFELCLLPQLRGMMVESTLGAAEFLHVTGNLHLSECRSFVILSHVAVLRYQLPSSILPATWAQGDCCCSAEHDCWGDLPSRAPYATGSRAGRGTKCSSCLRKQLWKREGHLAQTHRQKTRCPCYLTVSSH